MRRKAVTGGIAEGKSTVLGYLAGLGFKTLSADVVAKEVFSTPQVQAQLSKLLGTHGSVEPVDLRRAIGTRPDIRRSVNRIMHPQLLPRILDSGAEFIEVPLLIETCLQGIFDEIWVVTCGPEEQLRRLTSRIGSKEALQLLGTQLPTQAKIPFADVIVRTNEPEPSVIAHVHRHAFSGAR